MTEREPGQHSRCSDFAAGWKDRSSNLGGRRISHIQILSRPPQELTQPLLQLVLGSFPGVKRPERDADHLLPCSIKVKNQRS